MKPVDLLEGAVVWAKQRGIYVGRVKANLCGPVGHNGQPSGQYSAERPYSVNAFGAALLREGGAAALDGPRPYTTLRKLLDQHDHWLYRWSIGWDCRYILQVETTLHHIHDGWNPTAWRDDEVCKLAYQMSLRLCDEPRRC